MTDVARPARSSTSTSVSPRLGRRPALVRLQVARGQSDRRRRDRHAAHRAAAARARARRGALRRGDARDLPGPARAAAGRGRLGRARDRAGRRVDGLRRARRPRAGPRAAAPDRARATTSRSRTACCASAGRSPRRRAWRDGRGPAGRRRAVELVGGLRRGADPEGVPARRAGRQPGARAAALPVRARASRTSPRSPAGTRSRAARSTRRSGSCRSTWPARATAGSSCSTSSPAAPSAVLDQLHALGQVTGELHSVLGSDPEDPAFMPEEPSVESLALLTADVDEQIERMFRDLPELDALAPIAGRGQDVRERLQMLSHIGARRPRDPHPRRLHLGQTHAHRPRLGDPRLRGRAGAAAAGAAPQALAAARRGGHAALVLLRRRGRADPARRRRRRRTGRSARASSSSTATATASTRACCPPGQQAFDQLLAVFELEKAVYELRYELNNRPDWVGIPAAGIARLVDADL